MKFRKILSGLAVAAALTIGFAAPAAAYPDTPCGTPGPNNSGILTGTLTPNANGNAVFEWAACPPAGVEEVCITCQGVDLTGVLLNGLPLTTFGPITNISASGIESAITTAGLIVPLDELGSPILANHASQILISSPIIVPVEANGTAAVQLTIPQGEVVTVVARDCNNLDVIFGQRTFEIPLLPTTGGGDDTTTEAETRPTHPVTGTAVAFYAVGALSLATAGAVLIKTAKRNRAADV